MKLGNNSSFDAQMLSMSINKMTLLTLFSAFKQPFYQMDLMNNLMSPTTLVLDILAQLFLCQQTLSGIVLLPSD